MGTDFIGDLDINYPDGDVHKVPVLDDVDRQIKDAVVNTVGAEHDNDTGEHTIPSVTDAQEAGLNEQDGRLIWNNDGGVLKINISAAWLSLIFPAGTRVLFDQDAAPLGWTRNTDDDDRVVRIVSGARADGGSWDISGLTNAAEAAHTHSTPNHVHTMADNGTQKDETLSWPPTAAIVRYGGNLRPLPGGVDTSRAIVADYTQSGGSGTSGAGASHNHAISSDGNWRPLHRDVIVAVKD